LSGQIGIDPATGKLVSDDVRNQTQQVFRNIQAVLHAAGANLTQIARCLVLLTDMNDFQLVNEIYASFFPAIETYPARSTFAVKTLPADAKVEIECTAYTTEE
jgi:2-iminobutanoate/2-iminopropanoate deaminase